MRSSISKRVNRLLILFAVLLTVQAGILFYQTEQESKQAAAIDGIYMPLLIKSKDLQMSVVQVQQWLTDISATRGLDGLNDGIDIATENSARFHQLIDDLIALDGEHRADYQSLLPIFEQYFETGKRMAQAYIAEGPAGGNRMMGEFDATAEAINTRVDALVERAAETATQTSHASLSSIQTSIATVVIIFIAFIALLLVAARSTRTGVIVPLENLRKTVADLATRSGDEIQPVDTRDQRDDEIGATFKALNELITKLQEKAQQEQRLAAANGRIRMALDVCHSSVMLADRELNIIYHNDALHSMMVGAQDALRTELPALDPDGLIGTDLTQLHPAPEQQRAKLDGLDEPLHTELKVGGRIMTQIFTPVLDQGERIGFVVEWNDVTEEKTTEQEIQALVSQATQGDLSNRITLEGKSGFFARLATDLNELVGITESALHNMGEMLGSMSSGDLTQRMATGSQGVFGRLNNDANTMVEKLTEVLTGLRSSSENVSLSANELTSANRSLQDRTESQAHSLDSAAASVEEITKTIQQTSDNAEQLVNVIGEATQIAGEGEASVSGVIDAMSSIHEVSSRIAHIITVIDEIAFQTNLLALNAAVEAARAGDSGRSFAVVASEVRSLAQRSANSANEIKELINETVSRIDVGVERVNVSGEVLKRLIGQMDQAKTMVEEVSNAAREQSIGITDVNNTVSTLDEATQQNAALAEELSATAEGLAAQATDVRNALAFFTTEKRTSGLKLA